MSLLADMYLTGARRLRQWGRIGIGRLTGSTSDQAGSYKALMAIEEARLMFRAELSALNRLLVDKGVATQEEVTTAIVDEMNALEEQLAKEWPECEVMPDGRSFCIKDVQAFAARVRREEWPP